MILIRAQAAADRLESDSDPGVFGGVLVVEVAGGDGGDGGDGGQLVDRGEAAGDGGIGGAAVLEGAQVGGDGVRWAHALFVAPGTAETGLGDVAPSALALDETWPMKRILG